MKKLLCLAGGVVAAVFSVVLFATPAAAGPAPDGRRLFVEAHTCNLCHSVRAARIPAETRSDEDKGGDLSGKIEGEFQDIAAYVRKEAELDGKTHKKPFKGTDEELQAIIDWLGSLEAAE